jgi:hypothetical protein
VKAVLCAERVPPSRGNEIWAMDVVHDQLALGTKIRVLTMSIRSADSRRLSSRAFDFEEPTSWKR